MKKTMMILALMATLPLASFAGDGTKENPYTVAELNAHKDDLAASGATAWVKADLKGLGEDGKSTDNADTEEGGKTVKHMAGLFGDATDTFVAYSWQILGQLAISDLTNTKDLLISLTYGTAGHPYGNSTSPQYANNEEPTDAHFSLEEVHGALSLTIADGYRGYHIPSCYVVPSDIVAIKVSAGKKDGVYRVNCENDYDGAKANYVTPKNSALVLLAEDGAHDFVLSAGMHEQGFSNGNALEGGTQASLNHYTNNKTYCYRFVKTPKLGFLRNSDNTAEVTLESKDEVYLHVSSLDNNFYGLYEWETEDKKWISWTGKKYSDYHTTGISEMVNSKSDNGKLYDLQGREVTEPAKGLYIKNGKKYITK